MATTAIHRLTLDPMENFSNAFFSETTNMIKAKLYINVHWMVLYKLYVFCSGMKFQMASYGRTWFNIGPYGKNVSKRFFSETTWTIETKLPRNDHTAGLNLTLDPMEKMFQNASSLKPLGQLKPNCQGMIIGRSSTNYMFFMPIGNPRWPPPQYID